MKSFGCCFIFQMELSVQKTKTCNRCGLVKPLDEFSKNKRGIYYYICLECDRIKHWEYNNTFDGFLGKLVRSARSSAKTKLEKGRKDAGICTITKEDLIPIWKRQNGKCYYSGIDMNFKMCSDWQCSLERLDDNKGYVIDNVVLVCLEFNGCAKWTAEKIQEMLLLVHEQHDDVLLLQEIDNELNKVVMSRIPQRTLTNDFGHYNCKKCNTFKPREEFNKDIKLWL